MWNVRDGLLLWQKLVCLCAVRLEKGGNICNKSPSWQILSMDEPEFA